MPFPASTREELQKLRSPNARVLAALDDHALAELVAASAGLSMLQTLRILHDLEANGVVERYGKACWGKR